MVGFASCKPAGVLVLVLFAFIVLGLVSSVLGQDIGWQERLRNDPCLCRVRSMTLTQPIRTCVFVCVCMRACVQFEAVESD